MGQAEFRHQPGKDGAASALMKTLASAVGPVRRGRFGPACLKREVT
jgi:hypothetical protein